MDAQRERLFDQRTVERNIQLGRVTREEYANYLASLPDSADRAANSDLRFLRSRGSPDDR